MTVEEMKCVCTRLVESVGLDPVQVWGDVTTELMDLGEQLGGALISPDDAFAIGFALGTYFATDDGGVGPAAELPTPERTAH